VVIVHTQLKPGLTSDRLIRGLVKVLWSSTGPPPRKDRNNDMMFTMACRNICELLSSRTKVGYSYYADGRKYCRRC